MDKEYLTVISDDWLHFTNACKEARDLFKQIISFDASFNNPTKLMGHLQELSGIKITETGKYKDWLSWLRMKVDSNEEAIKEFNVSGKFLPSMEFTAPCVINEELNLLSATFFSNEKDYITINKDINVRNYFIIKDGFTTASQCCDFSEWLRITKKYPWLYTFTSGTVTVSGRKLGANCKS